MELNVKEQLDKLQADSFKLAEFLSQVRSQMNGLRMKEQEIVNEIMKKQGAIDLLNNLNGHKKGGK